MDKFHPQGGEVHLKEGHEETDLSVRGIILFGVALAIAGAVAFVGVLALYYGLERWRKSHEPPLSAVEQQLQDQRQVLQQTQMKTPLPVRNTNEVKPVPDWYGREQMDQHLTRTFPTPRLQYDDVYDMNLMRTSEDNWLSTTGKDQAGNIHIPVGRAMDLLVQRGLPQVSGPFVPPMLPTAVPMVPAGPSRK